MFAEVFFCTDVRVCARGRARAQVRARVCVRVCVTIYPRAPGGTRGHRSADARPIPRGRPTPVIITVLPLRSFIGPYLPRNALYHKTFEFAKTFAFGSSEVKLAGPLISIGIQ